MLYLIGVALLLLSVTWLILVLVTPLSQDNHRSKETNSQTVYRYREQQLEAKYEALHKQYKKVLEQYSKALGTISTQTRLIAELTRNNPDNQTEIVT